MDRSLRQWTIRVSRSKSTAATRRAAEKLMKKHGQVDIRAMGAAIRRAVAIGTLMVEDSQGKLECHVRTYSVPIVAAASAARGHAAEGVQNRGTPDDMETAHGNAQKLGRIDGENAADTSGDVPTRFCSAVSIIVRTASPGRVALKF